MKLDQVYGRWAGGLVSRLLRVIVGRQNALFRKVGAAAAAAARELRRKARFFFMSVLGDDDPLLPCNCDRHVS